jgi:phosphatidylserine decarboxylase
LDREKGLRDFPLAKEGLIFVVPSLLLSLLLLVFHLYILSLIFIFLFLFFAYFFRNPKRIGQSGAAELTAPADGRVTGIEELTEEEFLKGRAQRVSTFMGLADVHVNRAPCEGVVSRVSHKPGRYGLAFRKEVDKENERNYILLDRGNERLLVVQIAGFLARRICCWIREKDTLRKGDPLGIIAFGSRVDIYIPPDYEIMVQLGQKVKSGLTLLARKKGEI